MHCCNGGEPALSAVTAPSAARRTWFRRFGALLEWALPITTLALIPKCPACVAAYVLLFTGMGLSFSAADTLRSTLIALSIAALAYLVFRAARRVFLRHAQRDRTIHPSG
ncbi:MAG: hypothetical protein ACREJO_07290 [Phycisphaerales bacterium]